MSPQSTPRPVRECSLRRAKITWGANHCFQFHEYLDLWVQRGFFRMFRHWLQREGVRQRLLAFPDGERRLTNVLHLGEVLHQAETERRLGISGLLK